jgi:serine phosphatase RsbU (regulator of sigma subunit)/catechol 2,3-dioxygenase-like lactoylglutathione lyase family enzyme
MGNSGAHSAIDHATVSAERQDPYLRLQSVSVFVRDLDRSLRFYVDQLGFDLVFDGRVHPSRGWVAVSPPDGTATVTLVVPEPGSEQRKLIGRSTQIAFVTEDVLATFREWRKRGVQFLQTPRLRRLKFPVQVLPPGSVQPSTSDRGREPIWGGVFTRFKDLDGNSFSLVSFDALSRQIEEQRRAAAAKSEAERRAAQELEIARQVQARLFPQTLPTLRTLQYAGACIQARQVGGDYYDFLPLGERRVAFVVGDICGKGIAAALLMANLQANLRSQCAVAMDQPERLLRSVNQLFCDNTAEGSFATLFFAEYDDHLRRVRYASCGHLSALLLRSDNRLERLDSTCTVLGLFKDWDCSVVEERLFAGDTLALYTDGVTESFNDAGEEFGEERLVDALLRHRKLPPRDLLASIVGDVQQFSPNEQHDDITLIVAKCQA